MNVSIIVQDLGEKSGGPSRSTLALAEGLKNRGVLLSILTTNSKSNPNIIQTEWIKTIDLDRPGYLGFSKGFIKLLLKEKGDIYHIQGMFSYVPFIAPRIARLFHIPYIIAPRGMLYSNALMKSSKKKVILRKLILDNDLNHSACIQATCIEEMNEIRKAGITAPIAIIPNSINVPSSLPPVAESDKFRIGYVGRINEIKNIDGLLRAWSIAGLGCSNDKELLIIGGANLDSERHHLNELQNLANRLGLTNIVWAGMRYGKEKEKLLRSCSFTVLPSHSENFGMVVLESLINGIPCIASENTPWKILEKYECGWSTPNDPQSLACTLRKALLVSAEDRREMGERGQRMVKNLFSEDEVSGRIQEVYSWIQNKSEMPDFVYTK